MLNLTVNVTESGTRKYKSIAIDGLEVNTTDTDGNTTVTTLSYPPKTVTRMTDHFETLAQAVGLDKANTLIHNFLIEKVVNGADLSKFLIANDESVSNFLTLASYELDNYGKTAKSDDDGDESEPKTRKTRVKTDKNAKHIASAMAKLSVLFVPEGTEVTRERIEAGVENLRSKIVEGFDWTNVADQAYEFAAKSGCNADGSLRRRKATSDVEETAVV